MAQSHQSKLLVPAHMVGMPPLDRLPYKRTFVDPNMARLAEIAERHGMRGSMQSWVEMIANQIAAGSSLASYTTAKSVINPQALVTLPPNYFYPGKMLRIKVQGGISNIVTSQRTFTFQVMMGSIVVHTSGAITTTTTAHTLIPFDYEVLLRCDSVGSGTTAKFLAQGVLRGIMFVISGAVGDPTAGVGTIMCPNTAPAVGTGFDSTIANILDFWVGLSANEGTTGIQIYNYTAEALN